MRHVMTFDIFCLRLGMRYPLRICSGYTAGRHLKNIRLSGGGPADREHLYLLSWADHDDLDAYRGCPVLLFGLPEEEPLPKGNIVVLPRIDDVTGLINDCLEIFAEFGEWHEKLHSADENGENPAQMFDALIGYMQMEIAIVDQKNDFYYISAKKEDADPMGIWEMSREEIQAVLNAQQGFPESFHSHDVQAYPELYNGSLYYHNFFLDGVYIARLLGIFPDGMFASGQVRLFRYVAAYAEKLYISHYKSIKHDRKGKQFIWAMKNLLRSKKIPPQILQDILGTYGWKRDHTFQVLRFMHEDLRENPAYLDFLCSSIDQQFPSCCALWIGTDVFAIRNVSLEGSPDDLEQKLSVFLRENLCIVGRSNERPGIAHLSMLADEAADALYYGSQRQPTHWSFHFADHILDHLRDAMTARYSPQELEHGAIGLLRRYDQAHGTCLEETLRVFTAQRFSASAAAHAMYIHRSTFLHRLRRIQELTDIDLEDEREREWLVLSFFMQRSE